MVEHAKLRKRRRGLKVSRKPRKCVEQRIAAKVQPMLRKLFDPHSSVHENIAKLGIVEEVNDGVSGRRQGSSLAVQEEHPAFVGYVDAVAQYGEEKFKAKMRKDISDFDEQYIENLHNHFGDNFKVMARDIKKNTMQYSEAQLRNLWEKYTSWKRQVEEKSNDGTV